MQHKRYLMLLWGTFATNMLRYRAGGNTGSYLVLMWKRNNVHYDVIAWKHFPHYWSILNGIHHVDYPSQMAKCVKPLFAVSFNKLLHCWYALMLMWYHWNACICNSCEKRQCYWGCICHIYNLHFLFSIIILHTTASHLQEYSTVEPHYFISIIILLTLCTLSSSGK